MAADTFKQICECNGWACTKHIEIPLDVAFMIARNGYIVIVDGCPIGPSRGDVLIEKKEGYAIYKPK